MYGIDLTKIDYNKYYLSLRCVSVIDASNCNYSLCDDIINLIIDNIRNIYYGDLLNIYKGDWSLISNNILDNKFMSMFGAHIDMEIYLEYKIHKYYKNYLDKDCDDLNLIIKYLGWNYIAEYVSFDENFIKLYEYKLPIDNIVKNDKICLPMWYIDKYYDKINFKELSGRRPMTDDFVEKYGDKLTWNIYIWKNQQINEKYIKKYLPTSQSRYGAVMYQKLSDSLIEETIKKNIHNESIWELLKHQNLSIEMINKYIKYIPYENMSEYKNLSEELILIYQNHLELNLVVKNVQLSTNFIIGHGITLFGWKSLITYQQLSNNIIEFYVPIEYLEYIFIYQKKEEAFITKIINKYSLKKIQIKNASDQFIDMYWDIIDFSILENISMYVAKKYKNQIRILRGTNVNLRYYINHENDIDNIIWLLKNYMSNSDNI